MTEHTHNSEPEVVEESSDDPFAGYAPLEGLEHLGRHITDSSGAPSGSPANFEFLRGATGEETSVVADVEAMLAEHREAMLAELEPPAP